MFKKLVMLKTFLLLIILFVGCSKSEQTYWDEAINNQKAGKYKEAVASYQALAESYPQSEKAVKALFEVAKIYQVKMLKDVEPKQSMLKAIEFYNKIYAAYPSTPEAPKALFMKGFIESNELQNYDAAKKTYNLFLQKYPADEMAASARAELETIGLSPEEILRRNAQVSK